MSGNPILRTVAAIASAALIASLMAASVATPASAAKSPRCAGKVATQVGTARGEVIRGTPKADVIVARGGHDIVYGLGGNDTICGGPGNDRIVGAAGSDTILGQAGRDRLFGGAATDRLLGGPGDDRMVGGTGNDVCLQGTGTGLRLGCERPVVPVPAPVVVPAPVPVPVAPPPPEPPILIIAYSDLDGSHTYGPGDKLIAKLLDTDKDGYVSVGDEIKMGQYPTDLDATAFGTWTVTSHTVTHLDHVDATDVQVDTATGTLVWTDHPEAERYGESSIAAPVRWISDTVVSTASVDYLQTDPLTPSQPNDTIDVHTDRDTDDQFIDVDFDFPEP